MSRSSLISRVLPLALASLAGPSDLRAQSSPSPATLVSHRPAFGGYVGLEGRYSNVRGASGMLTGFEAALLVDHRVSVGVAAVGLALRDDRSSSPDAVRRSLGYGGVRMGYRIRPDAVVHPTVDLLIGGGGSTIGGETTGYGTDAFFVVEPTVGAEVNVTQVARLALAVSYRNVGGLNTPALRNADLSGVSVHMALRAGWF